MMGRTAWELAGARRRWALAVPLAATVLCLVALLSAVLAAPVAAAPPTASITYAPATPVAGDTVTFTARAQDSDGRVTTYQWELDDNGDFADGEGPQVTRTYDRAGTYRVYLRVVDDSGEAFVVYTDIVVADTAPSEPQPVPPASAPEAPPPAAPAPALLDPFPVVRVAGRVTSTGARLTLVSVSAATGTRVVAFCRGQGCRVPRIVVRTRTARQRFKRLEGDYRPGARLVFRIASRDRVGKYTRVVVRRGITPARTDQCLWPGRTAPRACP